MNLKCMMIILKEYKMKIQTNNMRKVRQNLKVMNILNNLGMQILKRQKFELVMSLPQNKLFIG